MAHTITREYAERLGYLLDLDPEEDIRLDYSGRFMYGKSCFAVTPQDDNFLWGAARFLTEELQDAERHGNDDQWVDLLYYMLEHAPESDSMGLGYVYYWPYLEPEED